MASQTKNTKGPVYKARLNRLQISIFEDVAEDGQIRFSTYIQRQYKSGDVWKTGAFSELEARLAVPRHFPAAVRAFRVILPDPERHILRGLAALAVARAQPQMANSECWAKIGHLTSSHSHYLLRAGCADFANDPPGAGWQQDGFACGRIRPDDAVGAVAGGGLGGR